MSAPADHFVASISADIENLLDYNTPVGGGIARSQKINTPVVILGNAGGFFNPTTSVWTPPAGVVVMGCYGIWVVESGVAPPEGAYVATKIRKNGSIFLPHDPASLLPDDGEMGREIMATSPAGLACPGEIMDEANGTDTYELFMAFFVGPGTLHRLQSTGYRTRFWGIAYGA
jgi:hypothetical protein